MVISERQKFKQVIFYQWPQHGGGHSQLSFLSSSEQKHGHMLDVNGLNHFIGQTFENTSSRQDCAKFQITLLDPDDRAENAIFAVQFLGFYANNLSIRALSGQKLAQLTNIRRNIPHQLFCTKDGLFWTVPERLLY